MFLLKSSYFIALIRIASNLKSPEASESINHAIIVDNKQCHSSGFSPILHHSFTVKLRRPIKASSTQKNPDAD